MESISHASFIIVAIVLISFGVRNVFWSTSKERARLDRIVQLGGNFFIRRSMVMVVLLGILIVIASNAFQQSFIWMLLGGFFILLGIIPFMLSMLAMIPEANEKPLPESLINKRVNHKKVSGVALIILGSIWIFNGISNTF